MGKVDRITERQLSVLAFLGLLSPMIRILPTAAVVFGGRAAWLSPVAAWAVGRLFLALIRVLRRGTPEGDGLAHTALRGLGPVGGRAFCAFCALWLTFYAGFVVRSAAERLLETVYPNGNTLLFVLVMLGVSLITAAGLTKNLVRTAEVLTPILTVIIIAVLVSAVTDLDVHNLLPVTVRDTEEILFGALPIFDVLSAFVYFLFLRGYVTRPEDQRPRAFPWFTGLALFAFGLTFMTLGTLGDKLAISMENAFFMVVRNIKIFGVVERIEAVVVTVWIVTDFIFVATILMIVAEIWKTVFGTKKRQLFVPPSAVASTAVAFLIVRDAFALERWSDFLIPAANMAVAVVLIPAVLAVAKVRRK